jgi:hypothetical protein
MSPSLTAVRDGFCFNAAMRGVVSAIKETLINCLSLDTPMDLAHGTGKKRRNTGGISSIFTEAMRQIGGVYGGRAINQRVR